MNISVQNCFHWIGYHIVHQLLLTGYSVYGLHRQITNQAEFLSFFLGRNSLFTFIEDESDKYEIDLTIQVDDNKQELLLKNEHSSKLRKAKMPLLFGEWMDMNEEGIFINQKYILFRSKQFINNAMYIEDFSKGLIQWIKSTKLPSEFAVYPERNRTRKDKKLDNTIYIRDNIPIEKKVEQMIEHYKKYKNVYYLS